MRNALAESGYRLAPEELAAQVRALGTLGDRTGRLVGSAVQLAQRLPQLGTAPPALHLAMRLRQAAGQTGLTGEIGAAHTELTTVHTALHDSLARYQHVEEQIVAAMRANEGAAG